MWLAWCSMSGDTELVEHDITQYCMQGLHAVHPLPTVAFTATSGFVTDDSINTLYKYINIYSSGFLRILTLVVALVAGPCAEISAAEQILRFGVVPQFDARQIRKVWQPVLASIEKQSGIRLEMVGSPSIPAFEKQFQSGEFDLAYMNPYHSLKAHEAHGYVPLVRDAGRTLFGIIVVRKDSSIRSIQDLEGESVAFPAPNALGAALLPRTVLNETYKINIHPEYVRSHGSVYLNVVTGQVAAGGGVQKTLQKQPEVIRDALKIIYKTPQVAPHPVVIHPRVEGSTRDKILKAFLQLGSTSEGRELLAGIPVKQIGQATLEDYEPLKQMGLDKYYVE